jgi:hypothetical protein
MSGPSRTALGALKALLRVIVLNFRSLLFLPIGLLAYRLRGRTPQIGYQSFIWAFCVTHGRVNDVLSALVSRANPKVPLAEPVGVLGEMTSAHAAAHVEKLRGDGYVLFERALSPEVCDRLAKFAHDTPALVRLMDGQSDSGGPRVAQFDPANPLAVRYDFDTEALLNNSDVQALLADQSLLYLVQEYLGCLPRADVLGMWWHTNYAERPDSIAAQFFHFDMDRIKWLKVFVYLTDVGPENGPHTFVAGSHRSGGIPGGMLRRGYVRLSDEEVYRTYSRRQCREFCAPRGSIIVEDTRGLHKGAHVTGSARLMLQLQFSNSLFGTNSPRARISSVRDPSFARMLAAAPAIYSQYT